MSKALNIVGGLVGLAAAVLWFFAARAQPIAVAGLPAASPAEGVAIYQEFRQQSEWATKLNAGAAILTGLSVAFTSVGSLFG